MPWRATMWLLSGSGRVGSKPLAGPIPFVIGEGLPASCYYKELGNWPKGHGKGVADMTNTVPYVLTGKMAP